MPVRPGDSTVDLATQVSDLLLLHRDAHGEARCYRDHGDNGLPWLHSEAQSELAWLSTNKSEGGRVRRRKGKWSR